MRPRLVVGLAVLFALALGVGLLAVTQRHSQAPYTMQDADRTVDLVRGLVGQARMLAAMQAGTATGGLVIDWSTVGFPKRERRLKDVWAHVELFRARYAQLPKDITELKAFLKANAPSASSGGAEEGCAIVAPTADSYLLNCDGWHPRSSAALESALASFKPGVQRYYLIDRHVILWVPSAEEREKDPHTDHPPPP